MKIILKTPIKSNYKTVFQGFDEKLFNFLAFEVQLKVLRFDGSKKGDVIELELIKPMKGYWKSIITADDITDSKAYFIDEGVDLPMGLGSWKHQHIIEKVNEENCIIVDQIDYQAKLKLLTPFLYIPLYFAFLPRKKKYRAYFN